MKKIFFAMSVAIIIALFSAPSFVKAAQYAGIGFIDVTRTTGVYPVYVNTDFTTIVDVSVPHYGEIYCQIGSYDYPLYYDDPNGNTYNVWAGEFQALYIEGYARTETISNGSRSCYVTGDLDLFYDAIPDEYRPVEPSKIEQIWDSFLDLVENVLGYRPLTYSIYDYLFRKAEGDPEELTFPTFAPTPTPTPTPTPIPVQTIFVPDGNGNTTIIYQYPDPTTGVITQSPYNPNIENNITVNCDCDNDGGGSGTFTGDPQDPYSLDASLLWADGFGVEMSENPLQVTENQQATLKEAAMEYDASVQVMSNSFNVLPIKWIVLAGLLGGILIIAGLIRTFLGG